MSTVYVVVEKASDAALLRPLIAPEVSDRVRILSSGGKYSMPSFARSVLDVRQQPVALVMDADSTQSETVDSQKREVEELLRMASLNIPFAVVMATPMIEVVLFAAPRLLERVYGSRFSTELLERANREPKQVLTELERPLQVRQSYTALLEQADADDIAEMRKHPVVRELNDFLLRVTAGRLQPA